MKLRLHDFYMYQNKNNETAEQNSYMIISKSKDVAEADFENLIQIIDESGKEVTCTIDKFVEIYDHQGLEGFIL